MFSLRTDTEDGYTVIRFFDSRKAARHVARRRARRNGESSILYFFRGRTPLAGWLAEAGGFVYIPAEELV